MTVANTVAATVDIALAVGSNGTYTNGTLRQLITLRGDSFPFSRTPVLVKNYKRCATTCKTGIRSFGITLWLRICCIIGALADGFQARCVR
jgi:hypothetical protein